MLMNSVNTNVGAMIALQNLNSTNAELNNTQNRINTGKRVASAKDNGAIWAIAQGQRAEIKSLGVVGESLNRAISTVDVALAAGESIADLLIEMKAKALAATDTTLDSVGRAAMNEDFVALRNQIAKTVDNAEFDGFNLIKAAATDIAALANAAGTSRLTVQAEVLALGGTSSAVKVLAADSFNSVTTAASVMARVEASITAVNGALARLGTASKSLGLHAAFIGKLSDSLEAGVGNLVDADLAKESAKLQALQTKQQLGVQALSIANSSAQNILSLFRG
jgi:flagellin